MIRSLRPGDLIALAFANPKDPVDVAKPRDRLTDVGTWRLSNAVFIQQWLMLESSRHTWVWLQQGRVRGLVSVRHRGSPRAWEVDRLLLMDSNAIEEGCIQLLDRLSPVGAKSGVCRVFLRLEGRSPLLTAARQSGFSPFEAEVLYLLEGEIGNQPELVDWGEVKCRRRLVADEYSLFQLYNSTSSPKARAAEGLTFAEWRDSLDTCWAGKGSKEFVFEKERDVVGWLRVGSNGKLGHIELMLKPQFQDFSQKLVWSGLKHLKGTTAITCLAPESQSAVCRALVESGFAEVAKYTNTMKHLAVRAKQSVFMPARAVRA